MKVRRQTYRRGEMLASGPRISGFRSSFPQRIKENTVQVLLPYTVSCMTNKTSVSARALSLAFFLKKDILVVRRGRDSLCRCPYHLRRYVGVAAPAYCRCFLLSGNSIAYTVAHIKWQRAQIYGGTYSACCYMDGIAVM